MSLDGSKFLKPFLSILVCLVLLLNLNCTLLLGQSAPDSLWQVWSNQSINDTVRLNSLNELIRIKFLMSNPDSAIKLSNLQFHLGEKIKSERHQGEALSNIGVSNDILGDYNAAMKNHNQALEIWQRLGDKKNEARTINHIAVVHKKQGNATLAIEKYMEALRINESIGNERGIAILQNNIGLIYYNQAYRSTDNEFRLEYLNKALERLEASNKIREELGDKTGLLGGRLNVATVYFELRQFDNAKEIYLQCLELSRSMNDIIGQSTTLNNLGSYFHKMAELSSDIHLKDSLLLLAADYYQESFVFRQTIGNPINIAGTYINLSIVDRLRAEYKSGELRESLLMSAIKNAKSAFELAQQSGAVLEMKISSGELAQLYKLTGDFEKALFHYETYIVNRDSILSETQKENIVKQELTYEFEKKTLEEDLRHQVELREQKNLRNTFIAGGAFLFLLVLFVFSRYRIKQRAATELATKNKQVEAARAQAERSEAVKQQFLANMSHEIRTPMNAITGLSRLLLDKPHDEQTTNYLKAISHSSNNLMIVLNDILDFSKIEAGKLNIEHRAFNLHTEIEVLSRIFEARALEKGLRFELALNEKVPEFVWGDSGRLSQILMNLLGNAVKFTEAGFIRLDVLIDSNQLLFKVLDSGPGIESEKLPLIFESFRQANTSDTRKFGGTGLGLTIAQNLAEIMSGKITVESVLGEGTIFSLWLPLKPATANDCAIVNQDFSNLSKHQFIVLVAEDNEYNFFVTRDTLLKYFPLAKIIHVESGIQAVEAIEEDDYDLILMDVQMPVMDGYEATKAIRTSGCQAPILGLTASVITSDLERCISAGMNQYIPKPFKDEELINAVASALGISSKFNEEKSRSFVQHKNDLQHYMPLKLKEIKEYLSAANFTEAIRVVHGLRPLLINNELFDLDKLCEEIELLSSSHPSIEEQITRLIEGISAELDQITT